MEDAVRRILVVDDDDDIRESLRFLFEDAGYLVEEASNGDDALDILFSAPHLRVMLLDEMMPHRDGTGVLMALVPLDDVNARTRIVYSTARTSVPNKQAIELFSLLSVRVLAKPFDLEEMLDACAHAWNTLLSDVAR